MIFRHIKALLIIQGVNSKRITGVRTSNKVIEISPSTVRPNLLNQHGGLLMGND
jgi:hypothetical protein